MLYRHLREPLDIDGIPIVSIDSSIDIPLVDKIIPRRFSKFMDSMNDYQERNNKRIFRGDLHKAIISDMVQCSPIRMHVWLQREAIAQGMPDDYRRELAAYMSLVASVYCGKDKCDDCPGYSVKSGGMRIPKYQVYWDHLATYEPPSFGL